LTGQAVIKESNTLIKEYLKEKLPNITDKELEEAIIYNDTDSVPYDTTVCINGVDIAIGDLYNRYANDNIVTSKHGHETIDIKNIRTSTYNTNTRCVVESPVKRLIRHRVTKRRFKIKTSNGDEVIMTEDHGLMVLRNDTVIRISPKEYKPGDKILIKTLDAASPTGKCVELHGDC
jgi:intein/homing endonuclease